MRRSSIAETTPVRKWESGFVSIFLDDIILWSKDPETHKKNLLRLFEVLSKEKLSLNMNPGPT